TEDEVDNLALIIVGMGLLIIGMQTLSEKDKIFLEDLF
ncbi:hypothetical protein LCGC14_1509180, partial [marine sediment metagenome]